MLEVRDELLTIAEIAIGITGFTAIIVAFLQRDGLHEFDRVRFVSLFLVSLATLNLAFLPIAISHLTSDGATIWSYSSSVFLVAGLVFDAAYTYRVVFPLILQHSTFRRARLPWAVFFVLTPVHYGVQFLNVTGWFWEPNFLPYLLGLLFGLFSAALWLILIVLYRPVDPSAA